VGNSAGKLFSLVIPVIAWDDADNRLLAPSVFYPIFISDYKNEEYFILFYYNT